MSQERGLDLVQVTEKVDPPICKIVEFGKYLYKLKKKEAKQSKHKGGGVKGVRIRFSTSVHDLETKAKQAHKFLEQGNKVKVELLLRGREKALRGHAQEQIKKFLEMLKTYVPIEFDKPSKSRFNAITVIVKKAKKTNPSEIKK
jgi:translation initiation factor IF-3